VLLPFSGWGVTTQLSGVNRGRGEGGIRKEVGEGGSDTREKSVGVGREVSSVGL